MSSILNYIVDLCSTKLCLADKVCTFYKAKIKHLFGRIERGNRFLKKLWRCVSSITVAWWWAVKTHLLSNNDLDSPSYRSR